MRSLPVASVAISLVLAVAACGGGDKKATTTTAPPSSIEETTTLLPSTTSTTIDPALRDFLLVKADLPSAFEEGGPSTRTGLFTTCDPATAPAVKTIYDAPSADGATFARANDTVTVSSTVIGAGPDQAEPALTQLSDPKVVECLETDLRAAVEKEQPDGSTVTLQVTAAKANVAGAAQTVLLTGTATVKGEASESTSTSTDASTTSTRSSSTTSKAATTTTRLDLVFLRQGDTILVITYAGDAKASTVAERQRIVTAAAKKLGGTSSGSSTTADTGSGSTSSSSGRSSTTRRSTSTSRRSTSSSRATTSTT